MRGLESPELAHQRVELGVGDLGRVVDVVALFVVADDAIGARVQRTRVVTGFDTMPCLSDRG